MKIYTIKDLVAGECGPLTSFKNDAVACRWFRYQLSAGKVDFNDFSLLCLGTFDSETGEIYPEVSSVEMTYFEPYDKPVKCEVEK